MALNQFIFGGSTNDTPETLRRNRLYAQALMEGTQNGGAPKNVGEGLNAIGKALQYRVAMGRAEKGDKLQADRQQSIWGDLSGALGGALGGAASSPAYGTTSGGGSAATDGRYTTADLGSGSSDPVSTKPGDENIYGDFISTVKAGDADLGLAGVSNPYGLAAVASTGKRESGYSAKNTFGSWSDPSESGQAGTAGGVMSWRAERLANMRAFASKVGDDPNRPSPATQAKFFLAEDPSLVARLNSAKSVEEAQGLMNRAWAFAGHDRPGGEAAERFKTANAYLPTFMGGDQQASAAAPPAPVQVASLDPAAGMAQVPAGPPTAMAGPDPKAAAVMAALGPQQPAQPQPQQMTPVAAALNGSQQQQLQMGSTPEPMSIVAAAQAGRTPDGGQSMTPVAAALAGQPAPSAAQQQGVPLPTGRPEPDAWAGMRMADAAASTGGQPQQMAQARQQMPAQGGQVAQRGPNPQVLLGILSNPWASQEQRAVAQSLLERQMKQNEPVAPIEINGRLVNPRTGQVVADFSDPKTATVGDALIDTRTGRPIYEAPRDPIEVGGALIDPNTMRPVYQAPDKPTGSMQEYGAYAADERAAGRQPVGRLEYEQAVRKAGSNNTTISTGGGDNKQVFDAMAESSASARSATTGLNGLSEAKRALDAGIISGAGADWNLGLQKIGAAFGVVDPTIIQNTETFRASIAPQVAAVMKATVGSANISNSDREFAEKAAGGSINLDAGSIRRLVDIMDRASRAAIQSHVERLDAVYPPGGQFERERALFGVRMPEPMPEPEVGAGGGQQAPQQMPAMMPSAAPQIQATPPVRTNGGRAYQGGVRPSAPATPAQVAPAPGNYRWNPATSRMEPM